jgi:hypothetical protein
MIMMKGGKGCYEGIALKNLKKEDVMKSKTMFVVLAGMVVSFIFLAVFAPGQASAQMKLQLSLGGVTGTNYMIGASSYPIERGLRPPSGCFRPLLPRYWA